MQCPAPVRKAPVLAQGVFPAFWPHFLIAFPASLLPQNTNMSQHPLCTGSIIGTFPCPSVLGSCPPFSSASLFPPSPSPKVCYGHMVALLATEEFFQSGRSNWGAGRRGKKKSNHSDQVPKEPQDSGEMDGIEDLLGFPIILIPWSIPGSESFRALGCIIECPPPHCQKVVEQHMLDYLP